MPDENDQKQIVTIYDIARETGLSYSIVSRVLNGLEAVNASTRIKVMETAERLGYVAHLQARNLDGGKSNVVGVLIPRIDNSYIAEILEGIDDELVQNGLRMMLYTTHHHISYEQQIIKTLSSTVIDGLLLMVPLGVQECVGILRQHEFPYVVIDQKDVKGYSPEVISTNRDGAYQATCYLIQLGHRRIAHITGLVNTFSAQERLTGYQAALAEHSIPFRPDYVLEGNFWEEKAYQLTRQLLNLSERPTAIFAANDLTAIGAMNAIRDHGLRVPADMSVIGFDNIWQAAFSNPGLTTVKQPLEFMGRSAVKLLMEYIEKPDLPPRSMVLDTELIIRESCAPVR